MGPIGEGAGQAVSDLTDLYGKAKGTNEIVNQVVEQGRGEREGLMVFIIGQFKHKPKRLQDS